MDVVASAAGAVVFCCAGRSGRSRRSCRHVRC